MQKNGTIVLLVNPLANKKRAQRTTAELTSVLSNKKILFESFLHPWPENINIYKEVWIIGGDGTLNYFLNFYKIITIPIVIFKGGTGNDFSWKLYGDMNVSEQIEKVLTCSAQFVDAAVCNDRIFINGVGIGFDGEVLQSISTIRLLGGHLGYLWIVLKKIFSFQEYSYQVRSDQQQFSGEFLLVMITNSSRTGGGFMVSPAADINDGELNMVLCKPLSILKRLQYLPVIEKGKHLDKKFILHQTISNINIECEKETLAQLDGELIRGRIFTINILPNRFLFKY